MLTDDLLFGILIDLSVRDIVNFGSAGKREHAIMTNVINTLVERTGGKPASIRKNIKHLKSIEKHFSGFFKDTELTIMQKYKYLVSPPPTKIREVPGEFAFIYDVTFNGNDIGRVLLKEYGEFIDSDNNIKSFEEGKVMWDKLGEDAYIMEYGFPIKLYDMEHGYKMLRDEDTVILHQYKGDWIVSGNQEDGRLYHDDYEIKIELLISKLPDKEVIIQQQDLYDGMKVPKGHDLRIINEDDDIVSIIPGVYYDNELKPSQNGRNLLNFNGIFTSQ